MKLILFSSNDIIILQQINVYRRNPSNFRYWDSKSIPPDHTSLQLTNFYTKVHLLSSKVDSVTRSGNFCTFSNFLKPLGTINLPKSPTFLGNFLKVSKSIIFLVKSFLGNFYTQLAIFIWSHWKWNENFE